MLRIIILFVAISAGGLSAWLLLAAKPAPQTVAASPQVQTVEVLVASADLPPGKVLGESDLRWQSWPLGAASDHYVSRSSKPDALKSLNGSMVRSRIVSGEPILEEKIARGAAGLLALTLPSGKRAVAIRVSAESAAGGFILPNDRVDVIQTTVRPDPTGEAASLGKTILTNIRVLAIDQKAEDVRDPVVVGKTATLELDAEQAEIIAAGQATGTLSLALRSVADNDAAPTIPATKRPNDNSVKVFLGERAQNVRIQ